MGDFLEQWWRPRHSDDDPARVVSPQPLCWSAHCRDFDSIPGDIVFSLYPCRTGVLPATLHHGRWRSVTALGVLYDGLVYIMTTHFAVTELPRRDGALVSHVSLRWRTGGHGRYLRVPRGDATWPFDLIGVMGARWPPVARGSRRNIKADILRNKNGKYTFSLRSSREQAVYPLG